ncbi:patatin-like phospholipase family protein [Rhizobacter sp. J219]|uniref:patatin-like phospholipase family protein n=1 Tax=Rhizobacter sp. J219 TaxID=2898430 RepID=UPI00215092BE|nr:patatin-like phospholipase family protein [Rhizobacter sp. J219]MCR5885924.1 patatin-like phospholipase family protein [Rhizobacter sp. J219]
MPRFQKPSLGLALQGGGAHGAFTWGVLDRLLEAGHFHITAISGTSAGAMNAIALADGWRRGGADGARDALGRFWTAIGTRVPFDLLTSGDAAKPGLNAAARALMHWTRLLSPYQFNPLGTNPLREVLQEQIDFEGLRAASPIALHIAATHANTGRLRLFDERELSVDAALASACLPTLHHAVVIDGEPYWDGGYSANPALFPLVRSRIDELRDRVAHPVSLPAHAEERRRDPGACARVRVQRHFPARSAHAGRSLRRGAAVHLALHRCSGAATAPAAPAPDRRPRRAGRTGRRNAADRAPALPGEPARPRASARRALARRACW